MVNREEWEMIRRLLERTGGTAARSEESRGKSGATGGCSCDLCDTRRLLADVFAMAA